MNEERWYPAVCFDCGHKDSSEHFVLVWYGDDGDMRCPKCNSNNTGEQGELSPEEFKKRAEK